MSKVQAGVCFIAEVKVNIMCNCTSLKLLQYWGKIAGPRGLWDSNYCNLVCDQSVSSSSWPDCYVYVCEYMIIVDLRRGERQRDSVFDSPL